MLPTIHISQSGSILFMFSAAFLGGVVSSLSPCSLSSLPLIASYIFGPGDTSTAKKTVNVLSFISGLSVVLSTMGIISAYAGKAIGAYSNPVITLMFASFILVMGLQLLELIELPMPVLIKSIPQNKLGHSLIYAFFMGGLFAIISSPCATPILLSIVSLSSFKSNAITGASLLFAYSMGQGAVILLFAVLLSGMRSRFLKNYSSIAQKAGGISLLIAAMYLYYLVLF